MTQRQDLTRPERARITEIQDMLIERFVEFKEATKSEDVSRAEGLYYQNRRSAKRKGGYRNMVDSRPRKFS